MLQPQFHCGTPPPAAAPRMTTRSMIRLLEIEVRRSRYAKVDRKPHMPDEGHIARRSTCVKLNAVIRRDYLRTALTYMLISMPHGTSTIFGDFQAIFGAPCKTGRNSALPIKVTP